MKNKNCRVEYDAAKKTMGGDEQQEGIVKGDARKRRRGCGGRRGIEWRKMPAREEDDVGGCKWRKMQGKEEDDGGTGDEQQEGKRGGKCQRIYKMMGGRKEGEQQEG